jgi:hypothetical protein
MAKDINVQNTGVAVLISLSTHAFVHLSLDYLPSGSFPAKFFIDLLVYFGEVAPERLEGIESHPLSCLPSLPHSRRCAIRADPICCLSDKGASATIDGGSWIGVIGRLRPQPSSTPMPLIVQFRTNG